MNRCGRFRLITFAIFICLLVNTLIVWLAYQKKQQQLQQSQMAELGDTLEKLHASFEFSKIFATDLREFFASVNGKELGEVLAVEKAWKNKNGFSDINCEIAYFRDATPLNVPDSGKDDWSFLMTIFNRQKERKYRTSPEDRNRTIKILKGGIGFDRLEGRPGRLQYINIGGTRSYGGWFRDDTTKRGVNGLIVFFHAKALKDTDVFRALVKNLGLGHLKLGFINLFSLDNSAVPEGFDSGQIVEKISALDSRSGLEIIRFAGQDLIVSFRPDGRVFCSKVFKADPPFPLWSWGLIFFWLPVVLRFFMNSNEDGRISLQRFVLLVFVVSVAAPVAVTIFYWSNFIESKTEAEKLNSANELEKMLIQLDAEYGQIFRVSRKEFSQLGKILNGQPHRLQEFIDKSLTLELRGMFDTCLLINSNGDFVRPYSGSGMPVRRLVLYDKAYRKNVFDQFFSQGWIPFDLEAEYAMNGSADKSRLLEFATVMPPQGKAAFSSLVSFVGKDLVRMHNSLQEGASINQSKDQVSSMVMSSMVENEDENPVARINHSLGDYVEFGFDVNQSHNYIDLIKDKDERALYCMILFSVEANFSFRYFNQVFTDREKWPENVNYMAVSQRLFSLSFPRMDLTQRMSWLNRLMQPPKNIHVEEKKINGVPHLLCAYNGKNCKGYTLIATIPLEAIEERIAPLRRQMNIGAFLILVVVVIIWLRLRVIAIAPARQIISGIRALGSGDHSHRIELKTGDEWQQLGETFNSAIECAKELAVANFVQSCILPAETVKTTFAQFAGRTVSADDVGGDYYDAFAFDDGGLSFIMGDVSGHSISAALVVSMAKAAFSAVIDSGERMPDKILAQLNEIMIEHLHRAKMMTCFCGYVDPEGFLFCANAGQSFPLMINSDGSIEAVRQVGYPLGVSKRKAMKCMKIKLKTPCRLLMFSDGVVEAQNSKDEPFGYEQLEELVASLGTSCTMQDMFDRIYREIKEFSGDVPWGDDVTLAILDYKRN